MTAAVIELMVILASVTALTIVNFKLMKKLEKEGWKEMIDAENECIFNSYLIGCGPVLY